MSKAISPADDHAARLDRLRDLCATLDDVREQSERLCHEITAAAHRASAAAPTEKLARGVVLTRTLELGANRRRHSRVPRDRAD